MGVFWKNGANGFVNGCKLDNRNDSSLKERGLSEWWMVR